MSIRAQKRSGQWSMSNLFRKIQVFFDENWSKKYTWQKISHYACQMNGYPSNNAKKAFPSLL